MLTQERLKEVLNYDPETGVFTWARKGPGVAFGKRAGSFTSEGYRRVTIDKKEYRAARLAWLYVYGEWPSEVVDHINRDRSDDRIRNLRDVPARVNSKNNGSVGVCWVKAKKKWQAFIGNVYLGQFEDFDAAVAARKQAELSDPDFLTATA